MTSKNLIDTSFTPDFSAANGITKYTSPDGLFKVTYYKPSKTQRFDSTTFKKENQDLYNKYLVDSERKAYVKFN